MLCILKSVSPHFSLDVEGLELPILKTILWDKLDISVVGAEITHGKAGEKAYTDYMEKQGYVMYKHVKKSDAKITLYADDLIYVKKELLDKKVLASI